MVYPRDIIERLRSHFPLSELIGRRVALKKHGREHTGLCPFHAEKSPSFTVSDAKGFFHCFGCAAHGDAIEFVKRYERLTYREAVEKLAREAGITLPAFSRESVEKAEQEKGLIEAMEAACAWFESNLQAQNQLAVRDYVRERGIAPETQSRFRMGFAPDARDGLKTHLTKTGFPEALLLEAGLIAKPESGAAYDRFRARLMFPIRNTQGRVIAFGGRLIGNSTVNAAKHLPKYLNSPETPLFKKGEVLFNLDQAGPAARDKGEIVIVEGYMDAVMMAQAGFHHTVATLGTAVTPEHVQKLWHYAPEPVLCLDGDAAGKRAMMRAGEMALPLLKPGYSLRFALLPKGEDPDSLIRSHQEAALAFALQEARGLSETLWRHFSEQVKQTAEARAALEHTLMGLCEKIGNTTVKSHYRAYFRRQIWQKTTGKPGKGKDVKRLRSVEVERLPHSSAIDIRQRSVRHLLKLSLLQPGLLGMGEVEEALSRIDCASAPLDGLREAMLDAAHVPGTHEPAGLYDFLEARGFSHAVTSLLRDESVIVPRNVADSPNVALKAWRQVIEGEQAASLEAEYRALEGTMSHGADEEALSRLMELQSQIKELKAKQRRDLLDSAED